MKGKHQAILSLAIIVLVLIIDQIIKVEVKTNMRLGEHITIFNWFHIAFVENNGMAFGWSFGRKIFLTLFRIIAVGGIIMFMLHEVKQKAKTGYLVCLALIAAGALGNIIDCLFYGLIFSPSTHTTVAQLVPWGEGYCDLFNGRVVDMFYFPLVEWDMPGWLWLNDIPLLPDAYEHCVFFSPVFNFADSAISVGAVILLLFYRTSLGKGLERKKASEEETEGAETSVGTPVADTSDAETSVGIPTAETK